MKQFFNEHLGSMTFQFTFIILLNAVIGVVNDSDFTLGNHLILWLALIILALWAITHLFIHYLDIIPVEYFHLIHFTVQIIVFFILTGAISFISTQTGFPFSIENGLINGAMFIILYFLTARMIKMQTQHLADTINQRLARDN